MSLDARLQSVIHHPLHQSLGVRDIQTEDGCGRLEFTADGLTINPAGMLHGGVVTHDLHVSVLRPVPSGQTVTVQSEIRRLGRAICFLDVSVESGGKLVATARVTKSIIPPTPA